MLTAKRHPAVAHLIYVVRVSDGQVVAKYNERHGVLGVTNHDAPRVSHSVIKAALREVR